MGKKTVKFWFLGAGLFILAGNALAEPVALIYRGGGACRQNCSDAAAEIPARLGLKIRFVTPQNLNEEVFRDAVLWVQPGGNALRAETSIGPKGLQLIKKFVQKGGGYVGFCAGAFLADQFLDDYEEVRGLGIMPGTQEYYEAQETKKPVLVNLNWKGKLKQVYFNGGGYFDLSKAREPVEILSHYEGNPGLPVLPAVVAARFGEGRVVVSGAHPEATAAWKLEDGLTDQDGSDYEIAEEMVRRAVPPGTLRE